jgi:hypothetical protein
VAWPVCVVRRYYWARLLRRSKPLRARE